VDGYGTSNFVKKEIAAGGALFDVGVYHIAQVLYLTGLPSVERISGKIYQELPMDPERRRSSGYNVEEFATGFVRCAEGVTVDIVEAWAVNMDAFEGSSIMGSKGGIRLDPFSFHSTYLDLEMNSTFELSSINTRWHRTRENADAYDSSQHHWAAALQGRVGLLPTADLALMTSLISEGIYLSDREGRDVSVDEVAHHSVSTALKL
jgi:predicted dehydrogenase